MQAHAKIRAGVGHDGVSQQPPFDLERCAVKIGRNRVECEAAELAVEQLTDWRMQCARLGFGAEEYADGATRDQKEPHRVAGISARRENERDEQTCTKHPSRRP